ncbi:uncharacterized protein LOC127119808 isoform X2 [Lathyrus oleraceus]|uniref:uncharacterized protein LOC127119808 isoform X2 n=1 Tax=Pisum sativum TaxID=3888 RepID=UPI0021CE6892|nr:uncharacterized protein LOC127119808 isoform X2 [Pisum sativum]
MALAFWMASMVCVCETSVFHVWLSFVTGVAVGLSCCELFLQVVLLLVAFPSMSWAWCRAAGVRFCFVLWNAFFITVAVSVALCSLVAASAGFGLRYSFGRCGVRLAVFCLCC